MTTITGQESPPVATIVWGAGDLPTGTQTIDVSITVDGVTTPVRGASGIFAAGGARFDDGTVPVGVPVTYSATAFNAAGTSLGPVAGETITIPSDVSTGWVSDPADPSNVVRVILKRDFGAELTTVRQVQTYQVGNRVVALLGARGKLQNLNVRVQTETIEDGRKLEGILAQTSVLIRTSPPADLPRQLYVVIPEVKKTGTGSLNDIQFGGGSAIWQGTATEISATTLDILVPVVTWQTYMDAFAGATWADVMAVYPGTWLDAIKNPPGV